MQCLQIQLSHKLKYILKHSRAHNIALNQKSEPCVQLKVDMKPFAEASEDWEPPNVNPDTQIPSQSREQPSVAPAAHQAEKQETPTGFQGLIMNQVCVFYDYCIDILLTNLIFYVYQPYYCI